MTSPDLSAVANDLAEDLDRAFTAYVQATSDGIYSGSLRMLGNLSDAEDVMQETYVRAYAALGGYSPERIRALQVRGWIWTIAVNLCRNRLRSRARKPTNPLGEMDLPASGSTTEESALSEIGAALQTALLDLPFPQRAAVVMRHVLDMTYEEVASTLDRPIGTVKADVHRGLARLHKEYPKEVAE